MESVTGNERFFDVDDLFFSTTDRKGVIERSNQTFVTLSRYPRDQLVGAPHNIIRHDDMPGAVFKLMWDDLAAGRPVCAYVLNRAADGLDYRVLATIVPVDERYLSVRMKPLDTATQAVVEGVYARVRAGEREAAAAGASRHETAVHGADLLAAELGGLGIPDLATLTTVTLPREVALLVAAGVRVPTRQAVGPVAQVLEAVRAVERDTDALVRELDEYQRLLDTLAARAEDCAPVTRRAGRVGALVDGITTPDPESSVPEVAARLTERSGRAVSILGPLPVRMAALRDEVTALRFRVALMRLHTVVVGQFAAAILDGGEEDPAGAIRELCQALDDDAAGVGPVVQAVTTTVAGLDQDLHTVVSDLDRCRRPLARWVRGVRAEADHDARNALAHRLAEAEVLADTGFAEVGPMAELAAQLRGLTLRFDAAAVAQRLTQVRQALTALD